MSTKPRQNIVSILLKRERGRNARFASNRELQRIAEQKAALAELQEIHCKLPSSVRSTFLTSFSPDSTKVASTHGDHKIYVCDVKTGKLLHKLEGHPRTPWCLAFHPTSNDILASGCLGGEVRVWHLHGGSERWRAYHNSVITSLAFHPLDKVLVIATFNEIHFWDWSLPEPFASCSTGSISEKVRFVKFDQLGNRLITGISNMQDNFGAARESERSGEPVLRTNDMGLRITGVFSGAGENYVRVNDPSVILSGGPLRQNATSGIRSNEASAMRSVPMVRTPGANIPGPSTLSHRRSLLTRLMTMYQHIDGIEDLTRLPDGLGRPTSPTQEEALNQARSYAEATTHANRLQRQGQPNLNDILLQESLNTIQLSTTPESMASGESREMLDTHEEFLVRAFWRTFYRLRSICTTLERRMLQLQRNTTSRSVIPEPRPSTPTPGDRSYASTEPMIERIRNATNDVASNTRASYRQVTSNYLINVLTRLQNSLQFSSLSNALAQEQIQQLQFRITEILDRLTNVTGYRARLTTLRDQIFEVAERTERRGGSSSSIRQLDLAHCLWLVEMSLQLTQQMQRILHADYRLTQLHINSSSRRTAARPPEPPIPGTSQASISNSNPNCANCGHGPADAGSSEEFDQAWDRLRVVVRRELETLTERFRSSTYDDLSPSNRNERISENEPQPPRQREGPSNPRTPSMHWSANYPTIMPPSDYPGIPRPPAASQLPQLRLLSTFDEYDSGPTLVRLREENREADNPRHLSSMYQLPSFRRGQLNATRNARSTSAPSSSQSSSSGGSGQSLNFFVPEIHIVPSASEDPDSVVMLPVHERPRSPPLPTILSGSNDPLFPNFSMYDSVRTRFTSETNPRFLHRIQCWDFSKYDIPSISNAKANVVVQCCKIHNDASVDISKDGEMLIALLSPATSVSSESLLFAVFSLKPQNLGQILLVSDYYSNAISVSFSPLSQYIVIGLATPRLYLSSADKQAVAQIFELKSHGKFLKSSHVRSLMQDSIGGVNSQSVSLNSVQWLPEPGQGLIYGTNRGCLCICKPIAPMTGKATTILKNSRYDLPLSIRVRQYSSLLSQRTYSASTQTSEPEMQTTGTQTFIGESRNGTR